VKDNIFEIRHLEFGIEEFQITSAQYNIYQTDDNYWELTFPLKRSEKLKEVIDAKPHFEVTAVLSSDNLKLEAGKTIYQKEGYDYERDEHLSNIYYFAHESIEDVEINIVEFESEWLIANIKGIAIINGSNGNKPDAELSVHNTKFHLDENLTRGIS
jgi:hypothetical protein